MYKNLNVLEYVCVTSQTRYAHATGALSLTGSASRTDLSQLANGIWEIHAGCPSFLRVSSVAKIGYIPQFKASNARDQDEVSSDLARMATGAHQTLNARLTHAWGTLLKQYLIGTRM